VDYPEHYMATRIDQIYCNYKGMELLTLNNNWHIESIRSVPVSQEINPEP